MSPQNAANVGFFVKVTKNDKIVLIIDIFDIEVELDFVKPENSSGESIIFVPALKGTENKEKEGYKYPRNKPFLKNDE